MKQARWHHINYQVVLILNTTASFAVRFDPLKYAKIVKKSEKKKNKKKLTA